MRFYLNKTDIELAEYDFNQVVFLAEMLTEIDRNKEIQLYKASALQAWLSGAAPDVKAFEKYLVMLGLSETRGERLPKEEELKKALSVIERVKNIKKKLKK